VHLETSEPNQAPKDLTHQWVIAAMIRVDHATAKAADFRGMYRVKESERVEALETYCEHCKRAFDEVADLPCAAKINNEHLIGGDQSVRAKRKVHNLPPGVVTIPVPAPRINRRGIDAVIRGEA
jgi:hypothetical protein